MKKSWKENICRQRQELSHILYEPVERMAGQIAPFWNDRARIEALLLKNLSDIPYCMRLYAVGTDGIQVTDNIGPGGRIPGHYHRDRSQRPYLKEAVPVRGFLLSDPYISFHEHRPLLTALQVIRSGSDAVGFLGLDFDLRDLPITSELYREPTQWRQVKGDPAIRNLVFQQSRVESSLDGHLDQAMSILEELLTQHGVFQAQIHFSSSQAIIWMTIDPYRYRILDIDAFTDPDICLVYPHQPYPSLALMQQAHIARTLNTFKVLRTADETLYLRQASINIFNGMISVTFSCDGSHYMRYDEFLQKNIEFWLGDTAA